MSKYSLYPIKNTRAFEMYKNHQSLYWTSEEIDMNNDYLDFKKMNKGEQHFIKMILAFFATADGIVNENLNINFINDFDEQEIKCFYTFQAMIENIHSETYSLLLDVYVRDIKEKDKLFNAVETMPCIKRKYDFCQKFMNNKIPLSQRLVAFACVEGIFFSGCFCSIFWLKSKGYSNGLTFSNEFIARDEGLHCQFAVLMYQQIKDKDITIEEIYDIIDEAVNIEKEFIIKSLPCNLLGMNSKMMSDYIEFVADYLLVMLRTKKLYNTRNPFDFMEAISLEAKSNFFEKRVSEYSKSVLDNKEFSVDDDF
jgi:ribonucleoside-diphosphate reductase beta chain